MNEEKLKIEGKFTERTEGKVTCIQINEREFECELNTDRIQGKFRIKVEK